MRSLDEFQQLKETVTWHRQIIVLSFASYNQHRNKRAVFFVCKFCQRVEYSSHSSWTVVTYFFAQFSVSNCSFAHCISTFAMSICNEFRVVIIISLEYLFLELELFNNLELTDYRKSFGFSFNCVNNTNYFKNS